MKKKLLILSSIIVFLFSANAQDTRYELSIHGAGGISTLQYKPEIGEKALGFGANFGLGYTYFFNKNLGIGTGVEFSLLNSKFDLSNHSNVLPGMDSYSGVPYRINYLVNDFTEKQKAWMVNIPIMLNMQFGKFYAAVGAKIGFPISASYNLDKGMIETTGFFEDVNWTIPSTGYEHLGFKKYNFEGNEGELNLKTAIMASAEIGGRWTLSEKWALYTGLFLDYGLNNIAQISNKKDFLTISPELEAYIPGSVLESQFMKEANGKRINMIDKLVPFAAGIKIKIAFNGQPKAAETTVVAAPSNQKELDALKEQLARESEARRKAEKEAEDRWNELMKALENQPKGEKVDNSALRSQAVSIIEMNVYGYDISQITPPSEVQVEMDKKVTLLKQFPDIKIVCIGHTCDRGSDETNMKVGLQRAEAAKDYLVKNGIAADRITTESRADKEPIVPNNSEENRRINRRVEFRVR